MRIYIKPLNITFYVFNNRIPRRFIAKYVHNDGYPESFVLMTKNFDVAIFIGDWTN